MKIAIQTMPLINNYGGILQAYALQAKINELGFDCVHLNRKANLPFTIRLKICILNILNYKLYLATRRQNNKFTRFINQYIILSKELINKKQWDKYIKENDYQALITGSDQIFRYEYVKNYFSEAFLDYNKSAVLKISYAASFGTNNLDDTPIDEMLGYLQKFNAISLREKEGVDTLSKYGLTATHVLDPTLLFDKEYYVEKFNLTKVNNISNQLFCYILDKDVSKNLIIEEVSENNKFNYKVVYGSELNKTNYLDNDFVNKPSIEEWLQYFYNANFIVTDSFHGMVFSIIFNKPFVVIGNESRGISRFISLLEKINLEDRIVYLNNKFKWDEKYLEISYNDVNIILEEEVKKSLQFLKDNLNA